MLYDVDIEAGATAKKLFQERSNQDRNSDFEDNEVRRPDSLVLKRRGRN